MGTCSACSADTFQDIEALSILTWRELTSMAERHSGALLTKVLCTPMHVTCPVRLSKWHVPKLFTQAMRLHAYEFAFLVISMLTSVVVLQLCSSHVVKIFVLKVL